MNNIELKWKVNFQGNIEVDQNNNPGFPIATVYGKDEEDRALNAKLISLAPEMINVLKMAIESLRIAARNSRIEGDYTAETQFLLDSGRCKQIIKKAKGEFNE